MVRRVRVVGPLAVALALTASCAIGKESVRLSTADTTPTATAQELAASPDDSADATPAPTPTAQTAPSPTPGTTSPDTLALRTRRPVHGFDLDPPDVFYGVEYHPDHGKSMVIDGHHVGIRFYHRRGTGQSVLVAVWSDRADGAEERLERYQAHTGDFTPGRTVHGAEAVWELRERSAPEASTVINLAVYLADGTQIWLSGVNIPDVSLLYEFLTRIEDAPGSLRPKPDPGVAHPGSQSQ
jgi:hypothetical protein